MPARRFPPSWTVEDIGAAFVVRDGNGQELAYEEPGDDPHVVIKRPTSFARLGQFGFDA